MKRAYPVLDEARMSSLDKSDTERTDIIRRAVVKERDRVVEKRVKTPKTLLGQNLKGMMDAPTRKIDRIVDEEAAKRLKGFKGKGKAN
jgi:hypothetical protein